MTKDEIKKMVNTCNNYQNCSGCPYNPKDISRFIGDRWKGGCPNYDDKLVYAMGKGYGKISEYKAEIDKLKAENARLTAKLGQVLLSIDTVKAMNTMCNIDEQIKQAVQEFAEWLKTKSEMFLVAKGCGIYGEKPYVSIENIDEILKEYE